MNVVHNIALLIMYGYMCGSCGLDRVTAIHTATTPYIQIGNIVDVIQTWHQQFITSS